MRIGEIYAKKIKKGRNEKPHKRGTLLNIKKKTIVTSDNSIGKKLRHGGHVAAFNC